MKEIGLIVLSLAVDLFFILLGAFVLVHLWRWFIVPEFGFAELSQGASVGIVLVVGFLAVRSMPLNPGETLWEMLIRTVIARTIRMIAYMAFGAILAKIVF